MGLLFQLFLVLAVPGWGRGTPRGERKYNPQGRIAFNGFRGSPSRPFSSISCSVGPENAALPLSKLLRVLALFESHEARKTAIPREDHLATRWIPPRHVGGAAEALLAALDVEGVPCFEKLAARKIGYARGCDIVPTLLESQPAPRTADGLGATVFETDLIERLRMERSLADLTQSWPAGIKEVRAQAHRNDKSGPEHEPVSHDFFSQLARLIVDHRGIRNQHGCNVG